MLGTRKAELLRARWTDIDFDQGTLRIPTTKAGRSHLLPLPVSAVDLLKGLPSYQTEIFVFPSDSAHDGHLVEPAKAWQRIRARADLKDVRIHDLRRTLGSWLAGQGYNTPLIGKALNHRNAASTAVYARLDLDPLRLALEKNSERMFGPSSAPATETSEG
jgi:integrase